MENKSMLGILYINPSVGRSEYRDGSLNNPYRTVRESLIYSGQPVPTSRWKRLPRTLIFHRNLIIVVGLLIVICFLLGSCSSTPTYYHAVCTNNDIVVYESSQVTSYTLGETGGIYFNTPSDNTYVNYSSCMITKENN